MSNTRVREGLLTLSSEGFVSQVPRRGFVVAPFTQQDIHDLFWAQAMLARELAARAAKKITPEQLARAEQIMVAYEIANAANDKEEIADLAHALHREINLAADSIRLATLLGSVVKRLPSHFYATIEGGIEAARHDHPLLIAALRHRDARRARRLNGAAHFPRCRPPHRELEATGSLGRVACTLAPVAATVTCRPTVATTPKSAIHSW